MATRVVLQVYLVAACVDELVSTAVQTTGTGGGTAHDDHGGLGTHRVPVSTSAPVERPRFSNPAGYHFTVLENQPPGTRVGTCLRSPPPQHPSTEGVDILGEAALVNSIGLKASRFQTPKPTLGPLSITIMILQFFAF